jgi:hypothetical protein
MRACEVFANADAGLEVRVSDYDAQPGRRRRPVDSVRRLCSPLL